MSCLYGGRCSKSTFYATAVLDLINTLFCEVNPIPVKAAMAAMGYGENALRLPMTPMEAAHEEKLLGLMKEQNLI